MQAVPFVSLLAKLRQLEEQGCWAPFVPTVQPAVGISRTPPAMAVDTPISALARAEDSLAPVPAPFLPPPVAPLQPPTDEQLGDTNYGAPWQ